MGSIPIGRASEIKNLSQVTKSVFDIAAALGARQPILFCWLTIACARFGRLLQRPQIQALLRLMFRGDYLPARCRQ
jgi:hypothetical protein